MGPVTILPVLAKGLPLSPRFTPYGFLSRCKFSTLTTRQPMVEFHLLTYSRFLSATDARKKSCLARIELTTSALAGVQVTYQTRPLRRRGYILLPVSGHHKLAQSFATSTRAIKHPTRRKELNDLPPPLPSYPTNTLDLTSYIRHNSIQSACCTSFAVTALNMTSTWSVLKNSGQSDTFMRPSNWHLSEDRGSSSCPLCVPTTTTK